MNHLMSVADRRLVFAACAVVPLLVVVWLGADQNWDLANYHLYNPHAWLTGRYATDIAPAQIQTWHSPLLDVPLYLLVRADAHSLLIGLWLTMPAMVALLAGHALLERLLERHARVWEVLAFIAIAASGAAFMPTIGSSMNDSYVAAGALLALAVACHPLPSWRTWMLAGLIAGFTAGLKLTAALYCIGLLAAVCAAGPARQLPARVAALGVGGLAGFLVAYLPWGLYLWQAHGNPLFPYFNNIFQSPDLPAESMTDARFRPKTLVDALLVPVRLLGTSMRFSEIDARDPRLLAGLLCSVILAWPRRDVGAEVSRSARMVAAFFLVSYGLWVLQYGILRYTTPLEVLAGAMLLAVLARLPMRVYPLVATILALAFVAVTVRPDWGRRPFTRHFLAADWPTLPADAMVVTSSGAPLGFFMLGLPDRIPAIAVSNNVMNPRRCTGLQVRAEARIRAHPGSFWLLESEAQQKSRHGQDVAHERYGLRVAGNCTRMRSSLGGLRLCPLARQEVAPSPSKCRR
jgi:hypothetical protein